MAVNIHMVALGGSNLTRVGQRDLGSSGVTAVAVGHGDRVGARSQVLCVVGVGIVTPIEGVSGSAARNRGSNLTVISTETGRILRGNSQDRLCVHCYGDVLRGLTGEVIVCFAANNGNSVGASSVGFELFRIVGGSVFHSQTIGS